MVSQEHIKKPRLEMSFKGSPIFKHVTSSIKFIRKLSLCRHSRILHILNQSLRFLPSIVNVSKLCYLSQKKHADHCCSYTGDENLPKHRKGECVLGKNWREMLASGQQQKPRWQKKTSPLAISLEIRSNSMNCGQREMLLFSSIIRISYSETIGANPNLPLFLRDSE